MNSRAGDDTFINHLMEETFSSISDDDDLQSPEELLSYYTGKNEVLNGVHTWKDVLEDVQAQSAFLEYRQDTHCFRFENGDKSLDFPSNWSVFSELKEAQDNEKDFYLRIDQSPDQELWEVLRNEIFKKDYVAIAVFDGTPVFIEFLSEASASDFSSRVLNLESKDKAEDRVVPDLPEVA